MYSVHTTCMYVTYSLSYFGYEQAQLYVYYKMYKKATLYCSILVVMYIYNKYVAILYIVYVATIQYIFYH